MRNVIIIGAEKRSVFNDQYNPIATFIMKDAIEREAFDAMYGTGCTEELGYELHENVLIVDVAGMDLNLNLILDYMETLRDVFNQEYFIHVDGDGLCNKYSAETGSSEIMGEIYPITLKRDGQIPCAPYTYVPDIDTYFKIVPMDDIKNADISEQTPPVQPTLTFEERMKDDASKARTLNMWG